MLFDSPAYFVFLIPVVLTYWRLRHRRQNIFLLFASYFFYGWWDWRFLALMIGSTAVDFLIAQRVAPGASPAGRKTWFILSLVFNVSILALFKYFNFFIDSFATTLTMLGVHDVPVPLIAILLPPGISFYTFQEVAYIVDVYKGRIEPAKSFVDYGLFISLFPHLIAGPIQRPAHLLPQVQMVRRPDRERIFDGLLLIASGLVRKCVIADNCAFLANLAFNGQLGPADFWMVLIGSYAFAWQIYGDFSGYSDIARGSAQLMGFHFMVNFRQPYLSESIQDFWRRWHISLSTWLRDYLYIPLGGSANGRWKTYRNLLITMVLAGLWHGANWTFVVFGAIHGAALAVERVWRSVRTKPEADLEVPRSAASGSSWARRILVFHVWCLSMVFFRSASLTDAFTFLGGLSTYTWRAEYATALVMLSLFSLPLLVVDLVLERGGQEYLCARTSHAFRTALATTALIVLALFAGSESNAFIYFQF